MKREIAPIAYIRTDFKEKFGIPRQSGRAPSLTAEVVFLPPYQTPDAIRGLDGFSHVWLLFDFSKAQQSGFSPTVRPPRLGGNTRVGVFASRSPFRPNSIGLSCVQLLGIKHTETDGDILLVSGADLLDGTPIFDIKPYLPHADCIQNAVGGYADENAGHKLQVECPQAILEIIPVEKRAGLIECLADDPRPSYQTDETRVYGMRFGEWNIRFQVQADILRVIEISVDKAD